MAKRHGRPSLEYRYEHYDPRFIERCSPLLTIAATPAL